VLGIFLGSWLIVIGTVISGAFAARKVLDDWWLLLLLGLVEVPLGVLALADPGATLAALITVGGIWAVAIGATRIVLAFQLRNLPNEVDKAYAGRTSNGATGRSQVRALRPSGGSRIELKGHPQPRGILHRRSVRAPARAAHRRLSGSNGLTTDSRG
jgi:uncharacterized protein (DUF58 family)